MLIYCGETDAVHSSIFRIWNGQVRSENQVLQWGGKCWGLFSITSVAMEGLIPELAVGNNLLAGVASLFQFSFQNL